MKLADDLRPGTYRFMCLVHGPQMAGKVVVVPAGAQVQTVDQVRQAGKVELNGLVGKLRPSLDKANVGAPGHVQAGIDAEDVPAEAITFAPNKISIPVGGSVTWKLGFHTVSFNAPTDAQPDILRSANGTVRLNPKTFLAVQSPTPHPPAGGQSGSKAPPPPTTVDAGRWDCSGFLNSGSIEAPGDVFYKLTFTKAGTYPYVCLIHVDMKGTVTVG